MLLEQRGLWNPLAGPFGLSPLRLQDQLSMEPPPKVCVWRHGHKESLKLFGQIQQSLHLLVPRERLGRTCPRIDQVVSMSCHDLLLFSPIHYTLLPAPLPDPLFQTGQTG
jgi:hypothetical protein